MRFRVVVAFGLALLFGSACGGSGGEGGASQDLVTVKVSYEASLQGVLLMVAEAEDLAGEHGLALESVQATEGNESATQLLSGDVDIGTMGVSPFLSGAASGDWATFGVAATVGDLNALSCGPDSGVERPEDVNGKTLAYSVGSTTGSIFEFEVAPDIGLSKEDWKVVDLSTEERTAAVVGGSADCMLNTEPYTLLAENEGLVETVMRYGDYDPMPFLLVATNDMAEDEELLADFLFMVQDAAEFTEQNPDRVVEILQDFYADFGLQAPDSAVMEEALSLEGFEVRFPDDFIEYVETWAERAKEADSIDEVPSSWSETVLFNFNHGALDS